MTFCSICLAKTSSFFDAKTEVRYYSCAECEAVMKEPLFYLEKSEEKNHYTKHENTLENVGYVQMFIEFMEFALSGYLPKGASILDYGSGPEPVLSELLTRDGYEVDIYDPFFAPKEVYKNRLYDGITSTEVFEHFHNPLKEIEAISKHLKSGGILSIMTQFRPMRREEFLKWWYIRDATHVLFYTPRTFEVIAKMFNMRVLKHDNKKNIVIEKL